MPSTANRRDHPSGAAKPDGRFESRDLLWMAVGAALLVLLTSVVLRFYKERDIASEVALRTRRVDLVARMHASLASAAEAEKSAVLATTDEDSRAFADRARALDADVEERRQELAAALEAGGNQDAKAALEQFSQAFPDLRRIDDDILTLAVKNTNVKATALTFGPATDALSEMGTALAALTTNRDAEAPAAPALAATERLASRTEIAALRVLTMLPPHIAEQSDEKMTAMEARMAAEEQQVRAGLDGLAAIAAVADRPELATANAAWARFGELKTEIFALSRENTNVRSLDMSLNRKRAVLTVCENALANLQQAIEAEHIGGTSSGRWVLPR